MQSLGMSQAARIISSIIVLIFFFSSRRRHTRSDRDWSSDVCSSDLDRSLVVRVVAQHVQRATFLAVAATIVPAIILVCRSGLHAWMRSCANEKLMSGRSEERRVGKECRSRWSQYH